MDSRLVGMLLAFSCADASGDVCDASALLQTTASMHRSSVPTHFFDDQFNVPALTTGRFGRFAGQRDLAPPPMALFDVGADSVPMPPRGSAATALVAQERLDTSTLPLSLAESVPQPALLSQATEQAFSSMPPVAQRRPNTLMEQSFRELEAEPAEPVANPQAQQPDPLLDQAFKMVEEMHKVRAGASPSRGQPSVAMATEPPLLAQEAEAAPKEVAAVPKVEPARQLEPGEALTNLKLNGPMAAQKQEAAANRDREDAASSFVECQVNGGGKDCMDINGKPHQAHAALDPESAALAQKKVMQELQTQAAEAQRFEQRQLQLTRELQAIERNHQAHEVTDLHRMREQRKHLYERAAQWQTLAQKQRSREVEAFDQMRRHSQAQEDARLAQWRKLSRGWRKPAVDMRVSSVDNYASNPGYGYRPDFARDNYGSNPTQNLAPPILDRVQLPEHQETSFAPLQHALPEQHLSLEEVPEQRLSLEQLTRRLEEDEKRLFPTSLENAAASATQRYSSPYSPLPQQYVSDYSLPGVGASANQEFERSHVDSQYAQ